MVIEQFQHHCFTRRSSKQGSIFLIYHVQIIMAFASLQHIWSVLSQNLKEALDPNIEYTFPVHLHDLYFKKIDIYMYRSCDSVSVILILCIKVDNSFMGELLQGVNKIRAVLYFLKALCVASGLIFQNCEGVLGYYSLNKRRLCWEAPKAPKHKAVPCRIKAV